MKKQTGFTLIEMIMVIVILGIIGSLATIGLSEGVMAYYKSNDIVEADWQARLALERMTREIRAIQSSTAITSALPGTLSYTSFNGTSDTFTTSGSTLTFNGNVLANGVSSLTFTYYDSSGNSGASAANTVLIQITLVITLNNTNQTYITSVYPRNSA